MISNNKNQNRPKTLHNVEVGYFGNGYYVMPTSQQLNRMWMGIRPIKVVSGEDPSELATAIDSVTAYSHAFNKDSHAVSESPSWTKEEQQMLDSATKIWAIRWYNDGSIKIETLEPFQDTSGKPGWRTITSSEHLLTPPTDTLSLVNLLKP